MKSLLFNAVSLVFLSTLLPISEAGVLKDHQGHWMGELKIPNGPTVKIGAELFVRADGSYWATMSSPDQDVYDMPMKSVGESSDSLHLDAYFAGLTLTWVDDHFKGVFKQGDFTQTMDLHQIDKFPTKARPQTPKAPFPYKDETIAFPSTDGVTLGATLSVPNGAAHPNVVILVPGSGPSNRNEDVAGHQPFAVLADYLARHGIAVVRFDKRGIGRSTGDYEQHTTAQLIEDVEAIVKTVQGQKRFKHVGLIGHSEGSGIAAATAARQSQAVNFVISLAGIGLPGLNMMMLQDHIWAIDHGATPVEADQAMRYVHKYYETVIAQDIVESRVAALKALYQSLSAEDRALIKRLELNGGSLSFNAAAEPSLRTLLKSDPRQDWRAVHCPVLVLNGSHDHQVPPKENIAGIVAAIRAGGNQQVESSEIPMLNHLFQTAITGQENEYEKINETFAPVALQRIAAFSLEH